MQVSVDEIKCSRKITLRKIYGHDQVVKDLVIAFKKKLVEVCNSLPGGHHTDFDESHETEISTFRDWTSQRTSMS